MRARLRKKLTRHATSAKLRAAANHAFARREEKGAPPFASLEEWQDWLWEVLFLTDFECYRRLGQPLFAGICWVKTARGPRPAWARKERRR